MDSPVLLRLSVLVGPTFLSRLSCPGCPRLSCPGCPAPTDLSRLSCPDYPVLAALCWSSFPSCPVLVILSSLSCPGCPKPLSPQETVMESTDRISYFIFFHVRFRVHVHVYFGLTLLSTVYDMKIHQEYCFALFTIHRVPLLYMIRGESIKNRECLLEF
jgi:hypothetical protein